MSLQLWTDSEKRLSQPQNISLMQNKQNICYFPLTLRLGKKILHPGLQTLTIVLYCWITELHFQHYPFGLYFQLK